MSTGIQSNYKKKTLVNPRKEYMEGILYEVGLI
jgi:hypothetical protein